MFTDECTAGKLRMTYISILVEIDMTQKMCEVITIKDNEGRKIQHKVEYEWKPQFCERCQKIGHNWNIERRPLIKQ